MKHLLKNITPLKNYKLLAEFQCGEKKYYDVNPWINKNKAFQPLKYENKLFEQMSVDTGGLAVVWNEDIDLYCDELYENGVSVR